MTKSLSRSRIIHTTPPNWKTRLERVIRPRRERWSEEDREGVGMRRRRVSCSKQTFEKWIALSFTLKYSQLHNPFTWNGCSTYWLWVDEGGQKKEVRRKEAGKMERQGVNGYLKEHVRKHSGWFSLISQQLWGSAAQRRTHVRLQCLLCFDLPVLNW